MNKRVYRSALIGIMVLCVIGLIGALANPTGLSAPVRAADNPISIVEHSTESQFGQRFIFHVKAVSTAGEIVSARLVWTDDPSRASEAATLTGFTHERTVDLEHDWYTGYSNVPPWQIINYRWEFTDSVGNFLQSEPFVGEVTDDTRDWKKLTDGKVAVYWYDQDQAFGDELFGIAKQGYAHVVEATGHEPDIELRVLMFNNQMDFCGFFAPGFCQGWYAGVTLGSITVQYLIPDQEQFVKRQVVPHELAHAFLNNWMGGRVHELPRWFNEGQATNNELEGLDEELNRARNMASNDELIRLPILDQTFAERSLSTLKVAKWYSQATSLVKYLFDRWGLESLGEIVRRVKSGSSFVSALQDYTGLSLVEFEQAWRESLGASTILPTIRPTVTQMSLPFPPTPTFEPPPGH